MKYSDIKNLSDNDLKDLLSEKSQKLSKLTSSHAVSPIENPLQIRFLRKDVARIFTELTKRSK
jgi:large subunit ribosomal protein L29